MAAIQIIHSNEAAVAAAANTKVCTWHKFPSPLPLLPVTRLLSSHSCCDKDDLILFYKHVTRLAPELDKVTTLFYGTVPPPVPLHFLLSCPNLCCQLARGQQLVRFFLVALLFSNCWLTNLMWNSIWAYCSRLRRCGGRLWVVRDIWKVFHGTSLGFLSPCTRSWAQSKNAHWQLNWQWKKPEMKWKWAKVLERAVIAGQKSTGKYPLKSRI